MRRAFNSLVVNVGMIGIVAALPSSAFAQPPSLDDIIQGLQTAEQLLFSDSKSFQIVYELEEAHDVTPTKESGGHFRMEWQIARNAADEWYSRTKYLQSRSPKGIELPADPITTITRDGIVFHWDGGRSDVYVDPVAKSTNYCRGWEYLQYIGFDPYRHIIESTWGLDKWDALVKFDSRFRTYFHEPYLPSSLIGDREQYQVLPEPEMVDAVECWVVEWPDMHRIWVDPAHGFAVRRRIVHWGAGQPERRDMQASDFREVKRGLWLPGKLLVDHYAVMAVEDESLWGKVAERATYSVSRLDVDQDIDGLFEFKLPSGLIVKDFVRDVEYVVPASGAKPFADPIEAGIGQIANAAGSGVRKWLVLGNVLFVTILVTLFAFRKWRARGSSRRPD